MKLPIGFTYASAHAGMKAVRPDLALILADGPCNAAGCFTSNRARAAPVIDAARRLPASGIRGVMVTSGNANALTGPTGASDVERLLEALGRTLDLPRASLLMASTGIIGHPLPVERLLGALPRLAASLGPDPGPAAEAMLTTDTRVKMASRTIALDGGEITIAGLAKGSGMVAPALATVLAVVVTDAIIAPPLLARVLRRAVDRSFNALTVDGDMSTNDSVVVLASGRAAGVRPISDEGPAVEAFAGVLTELCVALAREVAADGEGATRLLEVRVAGAPSEEVARDLARAVAGSSLVKTALFGADPNWGRILAALGGRAGSARHDVDPERSRVRIQGVTVYDAAPIPHERAALRERMRALEVGVDVELAGGAGAASAWGCDLSYDYVRINADYAALLEPTPDGGLQRDNRLANYSPAFKASFLVEALRYIGRFAGSRCVIAFGGEAMIKESLKRSFCEDVLLLRSVGLRPIVVHGAPGDHVETALDALGGELVRLLNREGGHAVRVSGKDAALLRVRGGPVAASALGPEPVAVSGTLLETLLSEGYVPVVTPVGLALDGAGQAVEADAVAAAIAVALRAPKLIHLTDAPGLVEAGELVAELDASALARRHAEGTLPVALRGKAEAALRALAGGVERVHWVDGRVPHSLIGELFTDRGVGTLLVRELGA